MGLIQLSFLCPLLFLPLPLLLFFACSLSFLFLFSLLFNFGSSLFFSGDELLTFFQYIFFCFVYNIRWSWTVSLPSVQLVDDLLIKPWGEVGIEICLQRLSEESLGVQYFICVVFEVFEILFGEDSAYHFLLGCTLLLIWFSILQLPPVILFFQSGLISLQFLCFCQSGMSPLLILLFFLLFLL